MALSVSNPTSEMVALFEYAEYPTILESLPISLMREAVSDLPLHP
jgi:hypothetical protein